MAANVCAVDITPIDIGQPYQTVPLGLTYGAAPTVNYLHQGIRCSHGVTTAIYRVFRIPSNVTLTAGLTIDILAGCDIMADNADLTGTNAYWDAVVGIQTDGTSLGDDSEFVGGTIAPQAGTITMPTAVGKLKKVSITGTIANFTNAAGVIAAGAWATLRVRRLGSNVLDTNTGIVVVAGIDVYAY